MNFAKGRFDLSNVYMSNVPFWDSWTQRTLHEHVTSSHHFTRQSQLQSHKTLATLLPVSPFFVSICACGCHSSGTTMRFVRFLCHKFFFTKITLFMHFNANLSSIHIRRSLLYCLQHLVFRSHFSPIIATV